MDKTLESLRLEVEEERKRIYMERFGHLPGKKEQQTKIRDLNN